MFKKILVALDHSKADDALLPQVKQLARLTSAEILLFHVSTGWAARWQRNLNLSDSEEIKADRAYLDQREKELRDEGFTVTAHHSMGEPAEEILRIGRAEHCDLIAMTTHGHRLLSDLIHGTTITRVRHEADIPIFLVKARPE
jgi:nucleotide-binding universal stress UspA family protein